MNAPDKFLLPDIQSIADRRNVYINRVGVKAMRHPIRVRGREGDVATVATVNMYVGLPPEVKGTHMSRFVEILQDHPDAIDYRSIRGLMDRMLGRLGADSGHIEMSFPYFIAKRAPVSGVRSLLDYQVTFTATVKGGDYRLTLEVEAPVTSLCPCSKEISEYGAHNQRSHITIAAELSDEISIEELVAMAEEEASCEVYGLLKRPDEKFVTERAYDNPKFVEDLVRDIALRLDAHPHVAGYRLSSENFESIHNHSAYALIERPAIR
jgi:GTP cyclohydrolase I